MKNRRGRRKYKERKHREQRWMDEEGIIEEEERASLLPDVILADIFLRLPMKTIIQCRCVCKTWRRLLSDFDFTCLLQSKPRPTLVLESPSKLCPSNFFMFEIESGGHALMKFNTRNNIPTCHVELVGSCNGLLCLFALKSLRSYYLCNPITGQYVKSPSPVSKKKKGQGKFVQVVHGFGFYPKSDQYTVLRIIKKKFNPPNPNFRTEGEVYTFGTENWRSIGEVPFPVQNKFKFFSVSLNGVLHWICERGSNGGSDIICALNTDTNNISTIATPHEFHRADTEIVLGVLEGCLYICDNLSFYNLEIWLLKNYGDESSWTKRIVIPKISLPKKLQECVLQPIMMLKDGELLIQSDCNDMILYRTREGTCTNLPIRGLVHEFITIGHVASFAAIPCLTF